MLTNSVPFQRRPESWRRLTRDMNIVFKFLRNFHMNVSVRFQRERCLSVIYKPQKIWMVEECNEFFPVLAKFRLEYL